MFSADVLDIDCTKTTEAIVASIRRIVLDDLQRQGAVVGLSGGVDSSVVATLCARALGRERVLGLLMPEYESSGDSLRLGRLIAERLGIRTHLINLGPALEVMGCYRYRDEAIRRVFPDFGVGWECKLVLPPPAEMGRSNVFSIVVESSGGGVASARLPFDAYLQVVAASNMKERIRKLTEYFHAEMLGYAVAGTLNRLEYDQGSFAKFGNNLADFQPIVHLYMSQVRALAVELGVPEEIRQLSPTMGVYSTPETPEESYFVVPYDKMDLCLWAYNHGMPADDVSPVIDLTPEQVARVYRDIESKRQAKRFFHLPPIMVEPVSDVSV